MMKFLILYIRSIVLAGSILLVISIYYYIHTIIPSGTNQTTKLEEVYAFLSVIYLYLSLLWGPLYGAFPNLPLKALYFKARRTIGVSAFVFGLLHAYIAFFGLLGGFDGFNFLTTNYVVSILFGAVGLAIFFLMTLTSLDYAVNKLGKHWKRLHRFVYIAAVVIFIHTVMLGSHFINLSEWIPKLFLMLVGFLVLLEAIRFDAFLARHFGNRPSVGVAFFFVAVVISGASGLIFLPSGSGGVSSILNIHAQHQLLAQQALQAANQSQTPSNIPGLTGDKTKRYTASFIAQTPVQPNQDTLLTFRVYDASSGNPISLFRTLYAWPMHLIIVDSGLSYYDHVHPTQQENGEFTITTQFPHADFYHLYIQFQPFGGIEQQIGFTLPVGVQATDSVPRSTQPLDTNLTKVFGDFEVSLDTHGQLKADDMTLGKETLSFTIKDAKTKKPIATLKPFMGAFGHLSMINQSTYDFLHVHPTTLIVPEPDANGGPTVDFLPIGIYGPFKPGVYRIFGEFSAKLGEDFDTNFTIRVE